MNQKLQRFTDDFLFRHLAEAGPTRAPTNIHQIVDVVASRYSAYDASVTRASVEKAVARSWVWNEHMVLSDVSGVEMSHTKSWTDIVSECEQRVCCDT
jgi:hypothetical protein